MPPNGPPTGGAEYLEHGGGAPLGPGPARSRNLRPVLIGGAVVAGLAVAGGAAWAAMSFLSTGAQPAEALPASTLGYVSLDLDPDGAQKIEAVRTLNKFPAFESELGLDTDDDLRRAIFDEIQQDDECANLDYEDDIEPWLGNRAAFAAVDLAAEEEPALVAAVQVTDADAATAGLAKVDNCSSTGDADTPSAGDSPTGRFVISGDWAILAESGELAEQVSSAAAESSLADDAGFQSWTERAGDPGVVSMYAAADAASVLFDSMAGLLPMAGLDPAQARSSQDPAEEMEKAFAGFEGMAATLRFDDGAIEFETAGGFGLQSTSFYGTDGGDDVMSTLPADTAAAFGMGFEEGWLTQLVDQMSAASGGQTAEELLEELSALTGLDLPLDAETLLGESAVLAVGSGFDTEQLMNSADGSDVPVGLKVEGDPGAVEAVLEKLKPQLGPNGASILDADADGDSIAIGPSADYRGELLAGGTLGESDAFRDVIREAEQAGVIFYLDFDAGDSWLTALAGDDPEVADNLDPLSALGMSAWSEGDVAHGVLRLTTDD